MTGGPWPLVSGAWSGSGGGGRNASAGSYASLADVGPEDDSEICRKRGTDCDAGSGSGGGAGGGNAVANGADSTVVVGTGGTIAFLPWGRVKPVFAGARGLGGTGAGKNADDDSLGLGCRGESGEPR